MNKVQNKKQSKISLLYVLASLLGTVPLSSYAATDSSFPAQWSLSGSLTLASDYWWRGISMSKNQPLVQGGMRLTHQSGFYAGVVGANSDVGNEASIEADYMFGYRHVLDKNTGITFQYIDINYPGSTNDFETNFAEFSVALDHSSMFKENDSFNSSISFSPDYYAESGKMWRFDARYDFPVHQNFGLLAAVGALTLENNQAFLKVWGYDRKDHYYDWKAGVTSNLFGLRSELYYADNSGINPTNDSMKARFVFSVTKLF